MENPKSNGDTKRDDIPGLDDENITDITPITKARIDAKNTLYESHRAPDFEMQNLLAACNTLPTEISHSQFKRCSGFAALLLKRSASAGFLTSKDGKHYEPMPGKEEISQKILDAYHEIIKTLRRRDRNEPTILISEAV